MHLMVRDLEQVLFPRFRKASFIAQEALKGLVGELENRPQYMRGTAIPEMWQREKRN